MQYLIEFAVFDTPLDPQAVQALRGHAFSFFKECLSDPRIKAIGHFTDGRHGFMLAELGSHEEVLSLTGPFLDNVKFTVKPVVPMASFLENVEKMLS
jgi:hypothetical protein